MINDKSQSMSNNTELKCVTKRLKEMIKATRLKEMIKKSKYTFRLKILSNMSKKNIRKALQGIKAMGHMNRMFICSIALSSSKATPTKPGCM